MCLDVILGGYMKKGYILSFILGIVITVSIGIGVYAISADQITYDDTTVDLALDDLYTKANKPVFGYEYVDFKINKSSGTTFTFSPNGYKYLYLFDIYWLTEKTEYSNISNRLKIKTIQNARYKEIGIVGKNGTSSSAAARIYVIEVTDLNENVTVTFNNTVDTMSVYGIN